MAAPADVAALTERLGREPQADFEVVVRDAAGAPVVVRNAPFTRDGTPMPTRYWLVDPELNLQISRLEAAGGVRDGAGGGRPRRDPGRPRRGTRPSATPRSRPGHPGPRPSGGVGGTREGVKCLHAHYANLLAGADDPVGRWTVEARGAVDDGAARWRSERRGAA